MDNFTDSEKDVIFRSVVAYKNQVRLNLQLTHAPGPSAFLANELRRAEETLNKLIKLLRVD